MQISNLSSGQILKEGNFEVEVFNITETTFEVQYISGACFTYTQADLDNKTLVSYIG